MAAEKNEIAAIKEALERDREARERDKAELLEALRESREPDKLDPKAKLRDYFDGADDPATVRERRRNKKEAHNADDE